MGFVLEQSEEAIWHMCSVKLSIYAVKRLDCKESKTVADKSKSHCVSEQHCTETRTGCWIEGASVTQYQPKIWRGLMLAGWMGICFKGGYRSDIDIFEFKLCGNFECFAADELRKPPHQPLEHEHYNYR